MLDSTVKADTRCRYGNNASEVRLSLADVLRRLNLRVRRTINRHRDGHMKMPVQVDPS